VSHPRGGVMWTIRCLSSLARPLAPAGAVAGAALCTLARSSSSCCEDGPRDHAATRASSSASGLGSFGLDDIPSSAYKAHFSEAYDAAAAKSAANVARRQFVQGSTAEPVEDRSIRLSIAQHLMSKLGYTHQELSIIGEDVLRMQGVKSPFEAAQLRPGEKVLDLGSGFGSDAFLASAKVGPDGSVTGIDLSAEEVKKASQRALDRGLREELCKFMQADMEALPLESESVDVVISNGGFCLCPNKKASFEEVYRVLRPGGRLAISCTVLRKALPVLRDKRWPPCMEVFMPWEDIEGTLRQMGFGGISVDGSNARMDIWDLGDSDLDLVASTLDGGEARPAAASAEDPAALGCSHAQKAKARRAREAVSSYLSRDREAGIHQDTPEFAHIKEFDMNDLCARVTIYAEKRA